MAILVIIISPGYEGRLYSKQKYQKNGYKTLSIKESIENGQSTSEWIGELYRTLTKNNNTGKVVLADDEEILFKKATRKALLQKLKTGLGEQLKVQLVVIIGMQLENMETRTEEQYIWQREYEAAARTVGKSYNNTRDKEIGTEKWYQFYQQVYFEMKQKKLVHQRIVPIGKTNSQCRVLEYPENYKEEGFDQFHIIEQPLIIDRNEWEFKHKGIIIDGGVLFEFDPLLDKVVLSKEWREIILTLIKRKHHRVIIKLSSFLHLKVPKMNSYYKEQAMRELESLYPEMPLFVYNDELDESWNQSPFSFAYIQYLYSLNLNESYYITMHTPSTCLWIKTIQNTGLNCIRREDHERFMAIIEESKIERKICKFNIEFDPSCRPHDSKEVERFPGIQAWNEDEFRTDEPSFTIEGPFQRKCTIILNPEYIDQFADENSFEESFLEYAMDDEHTNNIASDPMVDDTMPTRYDPRLDTIPTTHQKLQSIRLYNQCRAKAYKKYIKQQFGATECHRIMMNDADMISLFGDVFYTRGLDYFQHGHVLHYHVVSQSRSPMNRFQLKGVVKGSDDYAITIQISNGQVEEASCDCPLTTPFCKHSIAILLQHKHKFQPIVKKEPKLVPFDQIHADVPWKLQGQLKRIGGITQFQNSADPVRRLTFQDTLSGHTMLVNFVHDAVNQVDHLIKEEYYEITGGTLKHAYARGRDDAAPFDLYNYRAIQLKPFNFIPIQKSRHHFEARMKNHSSNIECVAYKPETETTPNRGRLKKKDLVQPIDPILRESLPRFTPQKRMKRPIHELNQQTPAKKKKIEPLFVHDDPPKNTFKHYLDKHFQ